MAINKQGYWEEDPATSYDLVSNLGQTFFKRGGGDDDHAAYNVTREQFISVIERAGISAEDARLLWDAISKGDDPNDSEFWGFARGVMAVFGLLRK